jgi:hypothetical protein
MSVTTTE